MPLKAFFDETFGTTMAQVDDRTRYRWNTVGLTLFPRHIRLERELQK